MILRHSDVSVKQEVGREYIQYLDPGNYQHKSVRIIFQVEFQLGK